MELEGVASDVVSIETKKANPDPTYRVRPRIFVLEAKGMLAELGGDPSAAEEALRQAVALSESLPVAFGPPTIEKPAHELLGELLLRQGRAPDAKVEFTAALARTPARRLARLGLEAASGKAKP